MARSTGQRNAWTASLLDIQRDDRILEVSFGPGVLIQALAAKATEGFVAGVDLSPIMLQQAVRRNAEAIREGRVQLQLGSYNSLGIALRGINLLEDILVEAAARHDVACVEWSVSSQPSVQGCLQSLSASLVTVGWKARGNVQGSF